TTVIKAFAVTHGTTVAVIGTATLEASPNPPPTRTNLANETNEPRAALAGFVDSGDATRSRPQRRRAGCAPAVCWLVAVLLASTAAGGAGVSSVCIVPPSSVASRSRRPVRPPGNRP